MALVRYPYPWLIALAIVAVLFANSNIAAGALSDQMQFVEEYEPEWNRLENRRFLHVLIQSVLLLSGLVALLGLGIHSVLRHRGT